MNFSHGRKMTRLCSSARHLSTLLPGIPHVVRVKVSLSDHSGAIFFTLPHPPSTCSYVPRLQIAVPVSFCVPYNGQKPCSRLLTTLLRPFTTPDELTRLIHLIAFLCSLATPFAIFDCVSYTCFLFWMVKCFAGNRELPLLCLLLITSLILPSEIPLTYCLYISTTVVYLFAVYSCPRCTRNQRQ